VEKIINKQDRQMAQASIHAIRLNTRRLETENITIRLDDTNIAIPKSAFSLLSDILSNMADGKSVSVIPVEPEITSQQAADMLHISRPFMVKLLETGEIPFFKVGSHRRILLKDVRAYKDKQEQIRKKQLAFLSKQAQKLNMGY
jgi:excisionase family DNA binding protein